VRRLYSSFARGAPGAGLLLLRLSTAAVLLVDSADLFRTGLSAAPLALGVASLASGFLVLVGLWTPVAAAMASVFALWHALTGQADPGLHFLCALLGLAVALLGPGGWSIDARLFGWKRFEIRNGDSNGRALPRDRAGSPPR
jgi:putative oxidoreductase